jgi:hypothetical protein
VALDHLAAAQQKLFQWEYERWGRKNLGVRRQKKVLAEFNSEIGKTIASKHLYLNENMGNTVRSIDNAQEAPCTVRRDTSTRHVNAILL